VEVETPKVPVVCPDGIVTAAGTVAAELLLDRPTCIPPAGAGAANVTVPVAFWPLATEEGVTDRLAIEPVWLPEAGVSRSVAETVFPEEAAVTVTVVGDETAEVDIGKVPTVCPFGMVMEAGTVTAKLLLDRLTGTPPTGAGEANITAPVAP